MSALPLAKTNVHCDTSRVESNFDENFMVTSFLKTVYANK
jgi:hypothetical protein